MSLETFWKESLSKMTKQDKEDILTLLATAYKIPTQYFILGLTSLYLWKSMKDWNPYAWMMLLLAIMFFAFEIITPASAFQRLFEKVFK